MATDEPLDMFEEYVTCPVCKDIYDDPHSLECSHTVCLPCLNEIKKRGRVECPECSEQMPFRKIKPDFKMEKLAESYKKEKDNIGIPFTKRPFLLFEVEIMSALLDRAKTKLEKLQEHVEKVEGRRSDLSASIAESVVLIDCAIHQLRNRYAKNTNGTNSNDYM